MKKYSFALTILAALMLAGCGKLSGGEPTPAPALQTTEAVQTPAPETVQPAPVETPAVTAAPARQPGERFDTVIIMEGMEETVHYEHIRNDSLGIEMDYDFEAFTRESTPDRERFVSVWDRQEDPENYFEIIHSPEEPKAVADFVSQAYSREYDITSVPRVLERAGNCVRIEASVAKGTNRMVDHLQAVYIIPAPEGCIVVTTHAAIEASEGFWRRIDYLLNTLSIIGKSSEKQLTDEQAVAAIRSYCIAQDPGLEQLVNAGEYPTYWDIASSDENSVVVVFRASTGALNRYYIDRSTGNVYVTEQVPGIIDEEQRTSETLNVWDYAG